MLVQCGPHVATALLCLWALCASGCGGCRSSEPESPRAEAPEKAAVDTAKFVGQHRCGECHPGQADLHAATGHADTFAHTRDSPWARELDGKTYTDPERNVTYHYQYDDKAGLSVTIPQVFGPDAFPLTYALGSNQHALTFVSLIPSLSGKPAGIEHRVTIFGPDGELGLTPGQRGKSPTEEVQMFGVLIPEETLEACIGCHTTRVQLAGTDVHELLPHVSCESCHGPGADHVGAMEEGLESFAISSLRPVNAEATRHQIEVCGRCHRMPKDLVPDDLHPDNEKLARFQPVGLLQSRCFTESGGMLACSTCHDPHDRPANQREGYVAACVKCHSPELEHQTACPVSPESDCISCHMPKAEVHPGISFHDHWIRVHARPAGTSE